MPWYVEVPPRIPNYPPRCPYCATRDARTHLRGTYSQTKRLIPIPIPGWGLEFLEKIQTTRVSYPICRECLRDLRRLRWLAVLGFLLPFLLVVLASSLDDGVAYRLHGCVPWLPVVGAAIAVSTVLLRWRRLGALRVCYLGQQVVYSVRDQAYAEQFAALNDTRAEYARAYLRLK